MRSGSDGSLDDVVGLVRFVCVVDVVVRDDGGWQNSSKRSAWWEA